MHYTRLLLITLQILWLSVTYAQDYSSELATVLAIGDLTEAPTAYETTDYLTVDSTASIGAGDVKAIYFDGLDYEGNPTKVFARIGIPDSASSLTPVPGIVLVHGGGATADDDWVAEWKNRGYAAIAIAVEGQTDFRESQVTAEQLTAYGSIATGWVKHAYSGPERIGAYNDKGKAITDQWMYHAVADTVLAHNLLRSLPFVSSEEVGVMGVSWGGIIVSTVIGIDNRFKFAIPVYGHGDLHEMFNYFGRGLANNEVYQNVWNATIRMERATMPTLWYSWEGDRNFSLDSQYTTYSKSPASRMVSLIPNMGHSAVFAYNRQESYDFASYVLSNNEPWCQQTSSSRDGLNVSVVFSSTKDLQNAEIYTGIGSGHTGDFTWSATPATSCIETSPGVWTISGVLEEGACSWYINASATGSDLDSDGNGYTDLYSYTSEDIVVSSDYHEINSLAFSSPDSNVRYQSDEVSIATHNIPVLFDGPGNISIVDVSFSSESHSGAFSFDQSYPYLLSAVANSTDPLELELPILFDNTVAGLSGGNTASAVIEIAWESIGGARTTISAPISVEVIAPSLVTYASDSNWSDQTVHEVDSVEVTTGAIVTLDNSANVEGLNIVEGQFLINDAYALEAIESFGIESTGELTLTDGSLLAPQQTTNLAGDLIIDGGSVTLSSSSNTSTTTSGTGHISLSSGELNILSSSNVDLQTYSLPTTVSGGSLFIYGQVYLRGASTLTITGDSASVSYPTYARVSNGEMVFNLGTSGPSMINNTIWGFYDRSFLTVNADQFAGGAGSYPLITINNSSTYGVFPEGNITLNGFAQKGFNATVQQSVSGNTFVISLVLTLNDYGQYLNDAGVSSALFSPSADPDRDGVPNLIEYATGSNPMDKSSNAPLDCTPGGDQVSLGFRRRTDYSARALSYSLKTSVSLDGSWSTEDDTTATVSTIDADYEYVNFSLPRHENTDKIFAILEVSQN